MTQIDSPLFSIVSVALNNHAGLRKTHASVASQSCTDYEWIVIDGASNDGTQDWLTGIKPIGRDSFWISERDDGLYDAMNKGLSMASGQYIIFLNAGDVFANKTVLKRVCDVISAKNSPDFVYGDALEATGTPKNALKKARGVRQINRGMITHHQAMFYKLDIAKTLAYDLKYHLAADYDFTVRFLKAAKTKHLCDFAICLFEQGGLSQQYAAQSRLEEFKIRRKNGVNLVLNASVWLRQTAALWLRQQRPEAYFALRQLFLPRRSRSSC